MLKKKKKRKRHQGSKRGVKEMIYILSLPSWPTARRGGKKYVYHPGLSDEVRVEETSFLQTLETLNL